jgi:hypothetical protein
MIDELLCHVARRPVIIRRYTLCRCRVARNILPEEPYNVKLCNHRAQMAGHLPLSLPNLPINEARGHRLEAVQRLCNTDSAQIEGTDALSDPGRPGFLREQNRSPINYFGGGDYPQMPGWRNRQTQRT